MNILQTSDVNYHQRFHFASKLIATLFVGALGAMTFGTAHAQATSSSIDGRAPTDSTVTVHGETGITRHGTANSNGRYAISSLPPGTYEVSLQKDGKILATLPGVPLFAGKAFEVDFACDNDQCTAKPGR